MFSPLLESIIEREKIPVVTAEELDLFAQDAGDVILFVAGDYKRLVEVNDAAVILPEIVKASHGALTAVISAADSERPMQARFRFSAFPAFIFLRNGKYLGVISKVLDWVDYVKEINEILAREPSDPPPFKLPGGAKPKKPEASTVTKLIEKGAENV